MIKVKEKNLENVDKLKEYISNIEFDNVFFNNLSERKKEEMEFHDDDRKDDSLTHNQYFYGDVTKKSLEYVDNWFKSNISGKVFLDYACGNGDNAIIAAQNGAALSIGMDISPVSIENCKKKSEKLGLNNIIFFVGDCENTKLPDNCIDIIMCCGMLHHLDLSYAFYELRRILSKDGKILAQEALDYNPIIKLYRNITTSARTAYEKDNILSLKDIKFAKRFFNVNNIKYWHLFSIFGRYFKFLLPLLNILDAVFLKIPFVKLMAWQFTFELSHNKLTLDEISKNKV